MNDKTLTKVLLKESVDPSGRVDPARVSAVCDYVQNRVSGTKSTALLREYMRMLKNVLAAQTATIESSGELSPEAFGLFEDFVKKESGKSFLYLETKTNPGLLGGVRITCADNVWENSVSAFLEDISFGNRPS